MRSDTMNDQNDFKGIASASSKVNQAIKSRKNLPLNKKFCGEW